MFLPGITLLIGEVPSLGRTLILFFRKQIPLPFVDEMWVFALHVCGQSMCGYGVLFPTTPQRHCYKKPTAKKAKQN